MVAIQTLGDLRRAGPRSRPVKQEIRDNLVCKLRRGAALFPGIIGYDETVIPQLVNAILSRHNFILLGLRGQAKSRILRGLVDLLDEQIPVVPGCEIHDDPLAPLCSACRARIALEGEDMPIAWLPRHSRFVEKLATPDVTIADMLGDIDPIKAAPAGGLKIEIPEFVREVVEELAFQARADRKIDKRSGVSQRLPITTLELVVSNAERRALANNESIVVPRVTDVYAALPSITGKFELEYEGELKGAETIARDLIRSSVGNVFTGMFEGQDSRPVVEWFDLGGSLPLSDTTAAGDVVSQTSGVQGLRELASHVGVKSNAPAPLLAAAVDFVLEGLYAQKKIGRSDDRGYSAAESSPRRGPRREEPMIDEQFQIPGSKKKYYN